VTSFREIRPIGYVESPIVEIAAIDGPRLLVRNLEAFDGTPILDVKPVLAGGR
jgi:tRNA (Thr-GGU) A37 N-methylase